MGKRGSRLQACAEADGVLPCFESGPDQHLNVVDGGCEDTTRSGLLNMAHVRLERIRRKSAVRRRSTVKSKGKGDSVSLEAFTTLTLDITGDAVTDIHSLLEHFCSSTLEAHFSHRGI